LSNDEQTQVTMPRRNHPLWAEAPWRAGIAVAGATSLVLVVIGPIDSSRQFGVAIGRGVGALLWPALFLGWHPKTRRWLPLVALVLAAVECLAAILKLQ
jgi:hypothetical protein